MSWRKFDDHRAESKAVKKFMVSEGYINVKVGHGRGTAWGWLDVHFDIPRPTDCYCNKPGWEEVRKNEMTISCLNCGKEWQRVYAEVGRKLMDFTGRSGDYNGDISIHSEWIEDSPIIEPLPVIHPKPIEPEKNYIYGYGYLD
jgi:hypothetical protein